MIHERDDLDEQRFPLGEREAHDPRDNNYRMAALMPDGLAVPNYAYLTLYDSRDGRTLYTDTPLNQGAAPACVGAMAKHILLCGQITNRAPDLSLLDIYHRAQQIDEWVGESYAGTSVRAGFKVLVEKGYGTGYVWTDSVQTVCEWIGLMRRPVGIGVNWRREMYYPQRHGGFLVPEGPVVGGHALVCDGYNLAERKVRILNSWGNWNTTGRAWITFGHLQQLFNERSGMTAASLLEVQR